VPFCAKKCPYCDFKSIEAKSVPEERFARCVAKELEGTITETGLDGARLSTVYLGGGTPSILSPGTISRIIGSIKSFFRPAEDIEVTLEVNPGTVDLEKLVAFRGGGVTRLSVGFQALDDRHLALLGRAHTAEAALRAFSLARKAGFGNAGVDLMFAIPGQTLTDWEETLKKAAALKPEHISLYGLTIEEATPFHGLYGKSREGLPDDELEAAMYLMAKDILEAAGYLHYEVSNFCLPGFESRHNSRYWSGAEYLGLGPSAHSYLSGPLWGRRWWNVPGPYDYMDRVERGESPVEAVDVLTRQDAMDEAVMLGLRLPGRGLPEAAFKQRFGLSPGQAFTGWDELISGGLVEARREGLVLTRRGLLFLNEILLRLSPKGA